MEIVHPTITSVDGAGFYNAGSTFCAAIRCVEYGHQSKSGSGDSVWKSLTGLSGHRLTRYLTANSFVNTANYNVICMLLWIQACKKARPMVNRQSSDP